MNMWNHTSFPAYKSRLWNMTQPAAEVQQAEKRKGYVFFFFFLFLFFFWGVANGYG